MKKIQNKLHWFLLLMAPLIAYYPIVLLGRTIGRAAIVVPGNYKKNWPVQDSYASALQDETWLTLIKESLANGEIPLVNMQNGLGAPLLESMQAGVFYILNPILLLFNTDAPLYFDIFALLHVYILVIGLYLLFSLFAKKRIAAAIAILIGLSGATYLNTNMVHFRGFVWLPLMLFSAVNIARGSPKNSLLKKDFILLFVATLASATAGSIQDFIMSFGVTIIVFGAEYIFTKRKCLKNVILFLSGMFSSAMIGMIAILPFFISKVDGNLFANIGAHRALQSVDFTYMSTWIIPKIKGVFPGQLFITGPHQQIQPDFPTVAVFLVIIAVLLLFLNKKINKEQVRTGFLISLLSFSILALLKAAHLPIFDFIQHIPLLNSLKFAKYNLFIVVLLGIVIAAGLNYFTIITKKQRRKITAMALIIISLMVIGVVFYFSSNSNVDLSIILQDSTKAELMRTYVASGLTLILTAILLFCYPKRVWIYLILIFIAHSALIHPGGYYERQKEYTPQFDVEKIELEKPRVLSSSTHTNQSLLYDFESIGVWDTIFNKSFREFMMTHFDMNSPKLVIQPDSKDILTLQQIDVLRLLGVNVIQGHGIENNLNLRNNPKLKKISIDLYEVMNPVPRIFMLFNKEYEEITSNSEITYIVEKINAVTQYRPGINITHVGANSIEFRTETDFEGMLIANQAFSTNWKLLGKSPEKFQEIFPVWDVSLKANETYKISYWPRGLTYGIYCALIGFFTFILTLVKLKRFE